MTEVKPLDSNHQIDVIGLLKQHGLPVEDINLKTQHFWGIYDNATLIACGAIEIVQKYGLLRSMAVENNYKNKGLGKLIFTHLLDFAKEQKLRSLYLLTLTASDYFKNKNFNIINRKFVPKEFNNNQEFKSLCPESAVCMHLKL